MKLSCVSVRNYKGLREADSPLSNFVCTIGENNAGKSSFLQSLLIFINGTKLSKAEYYDPEEEILITVSLEGVTNEVLSKLTEEHRNKLVPFVQKEKLTLARRYSTDGTSKLRVVTQVPKETKFHDEQVDSAFKGKKGKEIVETFNAFYPEITFSEATTQAAAKELIRNYVSTLDANQLVLSDIPLPTGIDNSVRSILPEPVYIPAVKDLSDDLKTKESASFGKLLNILLDVIEDDLTEATETFENLRKKLNRITKDDGTVIDDRMDRVKGIEKTIQDNLQETFRNVTIELEIPPPEIKTVLSNANIIADDGVRGSIENKGDGFKRAITFSILRSYVQLAQDDNWKKDTEKNKPTREKFLFLFEEPELYLHPRAQNILYDALSMISTKHQVIVTTHSPLFFSSDNTTTFVKIAKKHPSSFPKPIGVSFPVDLSDIGEKDKFQLISFETSNLGFFSRTIALVEGDSELIVLPHLAKLFNEKWDFRTSSTSLVKINGKGSFKRYRDFFARFEANVLMIADLDVLLESFDKLDPSENAKKLRNDLIQLIDGIIDEANKLKSPPPNLLKEELQRERAKELYNQLITARRANDIEKQGIILDDLFIFERTRPRLEILRDKTNNEVLAKKRDLLSELRTSGIYVLERGAIEEYYPDGVTGSDKPSKAQSFCKLVSNEEEARILSDVIPEDGTSLSELELILKGIFKTH
jgi:predicted ATP-dependent endonuclease of OLD family